MKEIGLINKSRLGILEDIIDKSYAILLAQIHNGRITLENESDLQLQFSYLLKVIGELHQFSFNDIFSLKLEVPYQSTLPLVKSNTNKAKIDIVLELVDRLNVSDTVKCAIELKFFKKVNQREPNNRYDAFADIHNLEAYVGASFDFGVFIMGTDHSHYVTQGSYNNATADFDLRDGKRYISGSLLKFKTVKPHGPDIKLKNNYDFEWNPSGDKWFLKLSIV